MGSFRSIGGVNFALAPLPEYLPAQRHKFERGAPQHDPAAVRHR